MVVLFSLLSIIKDNNNKLYGFAKLSFLYDNIYIIYIFIQKHIIFLVYIISPL